VVIQRSEEWPGTIEVPGIPAGNVRVILAHAADLSRASGRTERYEELRVDPLVPSHRFGQALRVEDRDLRADGSAATALDTLVRLDVHHPVALVDAVHGALLDTGLSITS
jgi:hypothetical protein